MSCFSFPDQQYLTQCLMEKMLQKGYCIPQTLSMLIYFPLIFLCPMGFFSSSSNFTLFPLIFHLLYPSPLFSAAGALQHPQSFQLLLFFKSLQLQSGRKQEGWESCGHVLGSKREARSQRWASRPRTVRDNSLEKLTHCERNLKT